MICRTLDKTISNLEMELASAKATQESMLSVAPASESTGKRKYFMVVGINTAFSSRKRRFSPCYMDASRYADLVPPRVPCLVKFV